jgi:hypothetical protein
LNVDQTGTYYNAGYGTSVLCSMQSASPSCKCVVEDAFRSIDPSLSLQTRPRTIYSPLGTRYLPPTSGFTYTNNSHLLDLDFCWVDLRARAKALGKKNTTAFLTLVPIAMMAELVVENGTAVGFGWNTIVDDVGVQRSGSAEET